MTRARTGLWASGLLAALALSVTVAASAGSVGAAPRAVWSVIGQHTLPWASGWVTDPTLDTIIWELRLPRVLLAAVIGAALGVVGAVLQAVVRNPLADPYIMGSVAGASLGAVVIIVTGLNVLGIGSVSLGAFLGSLAAFGLVLVMGRSRGVIAPTKLILCGVAVAACLGALTSYLVISAPDEEQVRGALFWLLGTLAGTKWYELTLPAVCLAACTVAVAVKGPELNALAIGDETAATLGVRVSRFRLQLLILSALLVGVSVALSGGIGFVALMVPHVARLLVGADHRRVLPVSALLGANFLVWVDLGSRALLAPAELPTGVITSILGGPALLYLLWRRDARLREAT